MSNQDVFITGGEDRAKHKNFIDAISELQQYSAGEDYQSDIPDDFWAWNQDLEFFTLGAKAFLPGFIFAFFCMPLSMAVINGMIPVYGTSPNLYDKIYVLVLCFVLMFGVLIILISASKFVKGRYTCKMVRGLYIGAATAIIFMSLLLFTVYQLIYIKFTPELLLKVFSWANMTPDKCLWLIKFNSVFRMCSSAVILFMVVGLITLLSSYFLMKVRIGKHQKTLDFLKKGK